MARLGVVLVALVAAGVVFAVVRVVSDETGGVDTALRPVHVHGLGVDPADGALYIATHSGLWRLPRGEGTASRVGDSAQDTMGFTVVGDRRFLGSGHPDLRTDLPPNLGLIESLDSGRTWTPVSLLGESDLHVLRSAGARLYGYDATNDRLLTSTDRGRGWVEIESPGPVVDLAVQPGADRVLVATAAGFLLRSTDGGRRWKAQGSKVGLLGWPAKGTLYLIEPSGRVSVSSNGGASFEARGSVGEEPAAFLAAGVDELYVALHDGSIRGSRDGGRSWSVRATP